MIKNKMFDITEPASIQDYEEAVFRNLQPGYMIKVAFSMTDEEEDIVDIGEEIETEVL